jgi:N-acetylmuramoyl-L-alanine amidase
MIGNATATGKVNVRTGPGTTYEILGQLSKGQSVMVLSLAGKWAEIIWWTGEYRAFVHTDYLKILNSGSIPENIPSTDPGDVGTARATGNVNVRTGPGLGYKKLGTLTKGQTVAVWSINGNWAEITWTGMHAYVHMSYLKFVD